MRKLMLLLAALTLAVPIAPASAADGTLDDPAETIVIPGGTYGVDDVPVPYTFDLSVQLPAGYWTSNDGGVEVAIRWSSEYNLFDLYVLNVDNVVVASATGFPTSAQSIILAEPVNGVYHIVVVPQVQTAEPDTFTGIAQVELKPDDPGGLVPDLSPLPPANVRISSRTYSFTEIDNPLGSCYPDEQIDAALAGRELTRCLRFDSAVANIGRGPFELRLDLQTFGSEDQQVIQDIYDRNGKPVPGLSEAVGAYTFHPTHGHMHFQNFASYTLYHWSNGTRGALAGTSRKADFCMIDTRLLWFEETDPRGNGPRNHHFPNCNVPASEGGGPTVMRQGIDVGWADVYTFDLPGQFIDISDPAQFPDGDYEVVVRVNPAGALNELPVTNNEASTVIHISGSTVTTAS